MSCFILALYAGGGGHILLAASHSLCSSEAPVSLPSALVTAPLKCAFALLQEPKKKL